MHLFRVVYIMYFDFLAFNLLYRYAKIFGKFKMSDCDDLGLSHLHYRMRQIQSLLIRIVSDRMRTQARRKC